MSRPTGALAVLLAFGAATTASAIIIIGGKGHALLPLAAGQVARVYVVNIGNPNEGNNCSVIVDWLAADGSVIGDPGILEVRPQQVRFVDFFDRALAESARRTVRAVIELDPAGDPASCTVQEAVLDATGRIQFMGDPQVLTRETPPPEPD